MGDFKIKNVIKYTILYTLFLVIVNVIASVYLVENISNHIEGGIFETLEYEELDKGLVAKDNQVEMTTYETYEDAAKYGRSNAFNFAEDGFVYNKEGMLFKQKYIIDYSWLQSKKYNKEEVKTYVEENKKKQVVRTAYMTNNFIVNVFTYSVMIVVAYYLVPLLSVTIAHLYVVARINNKMYSEDTEFMYRMRRVTKTQFIERIYVRFSESNDLVIITSMYTFMLYSVLDFFIRMDQYMTKAVVWYIILVMLVGVYYAFEEYRLIDKKRNEEKIRGGKYE